MYPQIGPEPAEFAFLYLLPPDFVHILTSIQIFFLKKISHIFVSNDASSTKAKDN